MISNEKNWKMLSTFAEKYDSDGSEPVVPTILKLHPNFAHKLGPEQTKMLPAKF